MTNIYTAACESALSERLREVAEQTRRRELDGYRTQYAKGAAQHQTMIVAARKIAPKKYRGYTVAQLEATEVLFTRLATASDAELTAHLRSVVQRARTVAS